MRYLFCYCSSIAGYISRDGTFGTVLYVLVFKLATQPQLSSRRVYSHRPIPHAGGLGALYIACPDIEPQYVLHFQRCLWLPAPGISIVKLVGALLLWQK